MRLSVAVPLLWAVWALLRFWIRDRWLPPVGVPVTRVALRVLVEQGVSLAGAGAATLTVLWVGTALANMLGAADAQSTRWLLTRVATASDAVTALADALGMGLMFLLTLAGGIVWHMSAKTAMRQRWNAATGREIERLLREREADLDAWNALPPDELMEQVDEQLSALYEHWQAVQRDASVPDTARQAESERIQAQAQELLGLRARADVTRRIRLDAQMAAPAEDAGWRERVMVALASRGLIGDAQMAASYVGLIAIALTLATMVGFAGSEAPSAVARALNALEVKATRKAAEDSFANAAAAAPAPAPAEPQDDSSWTPADEDALDGLARAVVDATLRSTRLPTPSGSGGAAGSSAAGSGATASEGAATAADEWAEPVDLWEQDRRDSVRRAILDEPGTGRASAQAEPSAPRGPPVVESAANPRSKDEAISALVSESKERLRADVKRPSVLRAFRQHAAEYRRVATPASIRSGLVGSIFGQAIGVAPLPGELQGVAGGLADELSAATVHEYMRAREVAALEALVRGRPFGDVLATVEGVASPLRHTRASREAFSSALDDTSLRTWLDGHAPAARTASGAPSDAAVRVGRQILASGEGAPRDALEAFATYDDYFPPRLEGEHSTVLGTLAREAEAAAVPPGSIIDPPSGSGLGSGGSGGGGGGGGGGGIGGGGKPGSARAATSRVSYTRGRSFRMARGFARVGGVLIGRAPEGSALASQATGGISWRVNRDAVTLQFGAKALGTYRAGIVDAALRYAADGRVTTVTMTSAAPLLELKILLHPVLEDTRTGAAAIELDRLVDTYARSVPSVRRAEERVMGQYALYRAAWSLRQLALLEASGRPEAQAATLRVRAELSRLGPQIASALAEPKGDLLDPRRSILASKPAWFDERLVKRIADAADAGTAAAWQQRLAAGFKRDLDAIAGEEDAKRTFEAWFDQPAEFQLWSGVREQKWTADTAFAFARGPQGDELWPFQFMLQAAFTTPAKFGTGDVDEAPFEFDSVAADIQRAVLRGIHSPQGEAAGHPAVVATMREFAVLQRVFRLAFAGQLENRFPIERLASLAADVRPFRERLSTPRWNPRPGALEAVFTRALDAATIVGSATGGHAALVGRLERCRAVVSPAASNDAWARSCDFADAERELKAVCRTDDSRCRLAETVSALNSFTRARRLRSELGVDARR